MGYDVAAMRLSNESIGWRETISSRGNVTRDLVQRTTGWDLLAPPAWASFAVLALLFPIDAAWYTAAAVYGIPKLPVGLAAGLLAFVAFLPSLDLRRSVVLVAVVAILALCASGIVSAVLSPYFDWAWVAQFFWYAAAFGLGYAIAGARPSTRLTLVYALVVAISALTVSLLLRDGWKFAAEPFNYLRPGQALFFAGLLACFLVGSRILAATLYVVVLAGLLTLAGRTFLYLWLAMPTMALVSWLVLNRKTPSVPRVLAAAASFVFLALLLVAPAVLRDIAGPRLIDPRLTPSIEQTTRVITGEATPAERQTNNSLVVRLDVLAQGLQQLSQSPVVGVYNGYREYAGAGSYIHNGLSYWHQYGVVGFAALLVLIGAATWNSLGAGGPRGIAEAARCALMAATLGLLLTRSYAAYDIFLAAGLCIGLRPAKELARGDGDTRMGVLGT